MSDFQSDFVVGLYLGVLVGVVVYFFAASQLAYLQGRLERAVMRRKARRAAALDDRPLALRGAFRGVALPGARVDDRLDPRPGLLALRELWHPNDGVDPLTNAIRHSAVLTDHAATDAAVRVSRALLDAGACDTRAAEVRNQEARRSTMN